MKKHQTLLALYDDLAAEQGPRAWFRSAPAASSAEREWSEVSFAELAQMARRMASHLKAAALERGSRVVFQHRRAWEFFPLLAACAANDFTAVPLSPELHPDEMSEILRHADPRLIIGDVPQEKLPSFGRAAKIVTLEDFRSALDSKEGEEGEAANPQRSPALIIYTSGTTGGSKAVMLREQALLSAARSNSRFYGVQPGDRVLGVVPFHHMNAVMATGLIPLTAGAQVSATEAFGFTNAKYYWQTVAEQRITVLSVNPSIMSMLLKLSPDGTDADLSAVRFAWCGAAPLPETLWRHFEQTFGIPVYQGYGLTETSFWVTCIPPDQPRHYDTVGVPVDCEIRIEQEPLGSTDRDRKKPTAWLADDAPEQEQQGGSPVGEVLIRSEGLMDGYYRNPKLTEATLTGEGFLRTGDLGYLGEDGYLRIVGRKKEIIIRNGINILPDDVDSVVSRHPDVKECKTIGLPDDLLGERIVTVCVLDGVAQGKTNEIRAFAREHLSAFKRPDEVMTVRALPRGATGKVMTAMLRRIVTGEAVDDILKALLKRRFRRAAPSDLTALRELVRKAVLDTGVVNFVSYWGCGDRDHMNTADREGLETLTQLMSVVSVVPHVRAHLTLVLNDMHGRVNGRVPERAAAYLGSIAEAARQAGFAVEYESEVWRAGAIDLNEVIGEAGSEEFRRWWSTFSMRDKLVEQAAKHSRARAPEEGARVYMRACQRANPVMERRFANHVFLTYNLPEFDMISPDLPKLYIYPSKRGPLVKPWFDDGADAEATGDIGAAPASSETV